MDWNVGDKFIRRHDLELGVGVVMAIEGRFIDVVFPDSGTEMRLSPEAAGIRPLELKVGHVVRGKDDEKTTIAQIVGEVATLADGTKSRLSELWPVIEPPTLLGRLKKAETDSVRDVLHRLDGIRLMNYRRRGLMPSLIGGRVELFPHQLGTAAKAIQEDTVRWLLADEVGLGKTIVASMITSALVRMGRVERALIVAPETLTVQWLGELYRKFHQVFVHIDHERLEDVRTDYGPEMNPFDVYPLAIVSFELLDAYPALLVAMQNVPPDLIVVDEAHQAVGSELESLMLPIVSATEHALLLTATPFQEEEDGFMQLANALRLPVRESGDEREFGHVSAVTRTDIHALGERIPLCVEIDAEGDLNADDPRVLWLANETRKWMTEGKKALVFVNDAARAQQLESVLTSLVQTRLFVFHEDMGTGQRDIELAQFRISPSPLLISSGAGSEGRNFQFCDVLVHIDLPDDPVVLEQRIGRIDRIGRTAEIPIVYFKTPGGGLATIYERVGIFGDASVGATPAMGRLRRAIRAGTAPDELAAIVDEVEEELHARARPWTFPDSHKKSDDRAVLQDIPADMEELIERFCLDAIRRLDMTRIAKDGEAVFFVEYGSSVNVESIPGLYEGARFLGTFDRQEAVVRDELDFFSNGHELVESLLAELEDNPRGRVGALNVSRERFRNLQGVYLLAFEGREELTRPRLIPLADAAGLSGAKLRIEARRLVDGLDEGATPLPRAQTSALMKRFSPALEDINDPDLAMVLLIVAL